MINVILFGPPGSGKGTQAKFIEEKFSLEHTSTGDLLRSEISANTSLGIAAKKFMDGGELVPDEVVVGMIENKLKNASEDTNGFIFDGFPRTIAQAEALDTMLTNSCEEIHCMLELVVSEEEIVKRLLKRGETSGRSDDRNEETIRNRFQEYLNKTAPVAEYYQKQGKHKTIKGEGDIQEITDELVAQVAVYF